jgi:hypothetical protein
VPTLFLFRKKKTCAKRKTRVKKGWYKKKQGKKKPVLEDETIFL